ncbi:MAG: hypothetical protein QM647_08105 [Asticcacaulis sp.]|uniref:hypothetical protein n=1 Tax=Asticcacaulis sp. TaxID=1872648 RepID=UPI0039E2B432
MKWFLSAAMLLMITPALAYGQTTAPAAPMAKKTVEIYRIAPAKHEAFLEFIAKCDKVNAAVGLPPRELYVHSDGADWDFLIIQGEETDLPADKAAAFDAAWDREGLPSGANFFFAIREYVAEHTDSFVKGPTTAADYLASRPQ